MTDEPGEPEGDDQPDTEWNRSQRDETPMERLDRNWADLLQELRVVQTGVQLLTGFLLTLPFQSRFEQLSTAQQIIYLVTLSASVISTGFLIAPVSLHRILFRRHARRVTVDVAHRLAQVGLAVLAVAMVGVVLLIFDVVAGPAVGWTAAAVTTVLLAGLWVALPLGVRQRDRRRRS
jgi:Family of unknown function (DUF6328)